MTRHATVEDLLVSLLKVPGPASAEDAEWLDLDLRLLGFSVRDNEGRRVDPMMVRRVTAYERAELASVGQWFGFMPDVFRPDPLSFIGAAANGERS